MAYLNVRNGGTTYSVGCLSSKAGAVPSGVPPLCVYSGGTTYYAKVSSSSTNAVASYRAGSATYYVVTKALKSEVESWVTLYSYSASSASSYTLSSTYLGYPLYIQVTGAAGSSGSRPSVSSTILQGLYPQLFLLFPMFICMGVWGVQAAMEGRVTFIF